MSSNITISLIKNRRYAEAAYEIIKGFLKEGILEYNTRQRERVSKRIGQLIEEQHQKLSYLQDSGYSPDEIARKTYKRILKLLELEEEA